MRLVIAISLTSAFVFAGCASRSSTRYVSARTSSRPAATRTVVKRTAPARIPAIARTQPPAIPEAPALEPTKSTRSVTPVRRTSPPARVATTRVAPAPKPVAPIDLGGYAGSRTSSGYSSGPYVVRPVIRPAAPCAPSG